MVYMLRIIASTYVTYKRASSIIEPSNKLTCFYLQKKNMQNKRSLSIQGCNKFGYEFNNEFNYTHQNLKSSISIIHFQLKWMLGSFFFCEYIYLYYLYKNFKKKSSEICEIWVYSTWIGGQKYVLGSVDKFV